MDDLLASIRKIIADEQGERARPAPRAALFASREARQLGVPTGEPYLTDFVDHSIMDAIDAADAEEIEASRGGPFAPMDDGDVEAAVTSIAAAIAAERQVRHRAAEERGAAWSRGASVEAGQEPPTPHPIVREAAETAAERRLPAATHPASPARAADRAAAERLVPGRRGFERPAEVRPRGASQPPAREATGLAPAAASARARLEARGDALVRTAQANPLPSNVYRLEPEQRTSEMTDAATDSKLGDGGGNVFRRAPAPQRPEPEEALTSARTGQSVSAALDTLSRTVISNDPRTLEDLVREMIRPLLREWLDQNLGNIVERQVRQEIERLSARAR